ncbi:hypothetical protein PVAR5_8310 [Paecilomyces variotii No. 5]|uniref:Uncharacterized protein n=1 Tax=Byssochlamys spectabilis (strain No. 5 / NBRC 109023) TaxID=1356009 RepID=V5GF60_BYSSN|nr:hypothetical protein PVAR5_8310 [Paecilomyces variotii No. 5]
MAGLSGAIFGASQSGNLTLRSSGLERQAAILRSCLKRTNSPRLPVPRDKHTAMTELYSGLHVGQRFASLEDFKNVIRSISIATVVDELQLHQGLHRLVQKHPIGQEVVDAVKRYHGYDISMRQAQRALTKLQPRRPRVHPDRAAQGEGSDEMQDASHRSQASHQDGSGYSDITANRWLHDQLPHALPPESSIQPNRTQNNQTVSQQSPNRPMPVHTLGQPQDHRNSDQHLPPLNISQNTYTHPQPTHTALRPPDPKPQNQQQQQQHQNGHPVAPQLVLAHFKIEFTCTTCGALNQSFFPNHGSIAGENYLQHSSSTQNNIQSHPQTSVSHRRGSSTNDGIGNQFDGNAVGQNRDIPSTWTASGLEIPITSGNP